MPMLELTDQEWQTLTVMLTKQPWEIANPILYKMAQQAAAQAAASALASRSFDSSNDAAAAAFRMPLRPDGAGEC